MPNLGPTELIIIAVVIILLFGAKKLPDMARSLGRSAKIFKAETKGLRDSDSSDDAVAQPQQPVQQPVQQLPPAQPQMPVQQAPVQQQPVQQAPVQQAPVQQAPVQQQPQVAPPIEQTAQNKAN
ncbi:preprotein translocase subunit TatA [Lentzea guizhouensis]|uniref:Sec-independent protein translocase protein TatA n=1 Tax=Lentzea guizhouensis TaxID=1586287 RepID=A0A1B2HWE8_9PSEU|nr:Sec-independent protein translocase subunit TatA [Lentzea guizhouensis]ANZ42060.1 preprotein translocase subunit TatA [Lentzea guizhouensis]